MVRSKALIQAALGLLMMGLTTMLNNITEPGIQAASRSPGLRLTVVFNNVVQKPGLVAGWGFSCLVEGREKTILFDTGADGAVLLENLRRLQLEAQKIDMDNDTADI